MKNRLRKVLTIMISAVILAACGQGAPSVPPQPPLPILSSKGLELREADEAALLAEFQAEARQQVERMTSCEMAIMPMEEPLVMEATADSSSGSVQSTDTNLQEPGVDEADVIKVRGDLAYILRADGVHVVRVWPAADFGEIAHVALKGAPIGLFAVDDRVVAITSLSWGDDGFQGMEPMAYYGLEVSMLDVRDPTAPRVVRQTTINGNYVSSRRLQDRVVLIVNNAMTHVPYPYQLYRPEVDCAANMGTIRTHMQAEIDKRRLADWLPPLFNAGTGGARTVHEAGRVYVSGMRGSSVVSVVQLTIDENATRDRAATIVGSASTIYASPQAVYAAQSISPQWDAMALAASEADSTTEQTAIHVFALSGDGPAYRGTGTVPGTLLNQFAMSEYEHVLRVATTVRTPSLSNSVYTLDATHADLPVLGHVDGLGANESIYAVRFVGDHGYVVTFKKIDPLFVIDLSRPAAPAVLGELKVPGFSTYLHPIAENRLIGIGKDAEDQGNFAWFQGLKVSLFDVARTSTPTEVDHMIIGARGSDSPALYDHHAVTYDPTRNLLALPVTVTKGATAGNQFGAFDYSGVHIYRVTPDGLELTGVVRDDLAVQPATIWWSWGPQSLRTVILGDAQNDGMLFLNDTALRLYDLNSFQQQAMVSL